MVPDTLAQELKRLDVYSRNTHEGRKRKIRYRVSVVEMSERILVQLSR